MKFFATLTISALAFASSLSAISAAEVPACDPSLLKVATMPEAAACTASTGFSAATLKVPAADTLAKVCADANCQKLLAAVTKAVPTECTLGGVMVKSTLVDKFPMACAEIMKAAGTGGAATGGANSTSPAGTTTAPASTTMAPGSTTAAPGATTMAPAAGSMTAPTAGSTTDMMEVVVSASSGSGSMEAETSATDAPAATNAVPTPSPTKSSASSVVVAATSAVLMAAAATLL